MAGEVTTSKLDMNIQSSRGFSPLHEVVGKTYKQNSNPEEIIKLEEEDLHTLKLLVKFHPDLNAVTSEGENILHLAVRNERSQEMIKFSTKALSDKGVDINLVDKKGNTALYYAVSPISYKFNGYDLYYTNFNFKFRDASIIKHLVEKGANCDKVANNGYSPLLLAVVMQKTDYVEVMLEKDGNLSKCGLEKTINTFCCNDRGYCYLPKEYYDMTPLQISVYDNNKEMAQMLISAGADVNAVHKYGGNTLHLITKGKISPDKHKANKEQTEIAKMLIDSGIEVNATDGSGETALHIAIRNNKKDIVNYILEKGLASL